MQSELTKYYTDRQQSNHDASGCSFITPGNTRAGVAHEMLHKAITIATRAHGHVHRQAQEHSEAWTYITKANTRANRVIEMFMIKRALACYKAPPSMTSSELHTHMHVTHAQHES